MFFGFNKRAFLNGLVSQQAFGLELMVSNSSLTLPE